MTIKSLHDSSYINCKKLTIYLDENFFQSNIFDVRELETKGFESGEIKSLLDEMEEVIEMAERKPTLYVNS